MKDAVFLMVLCLGFTACTKAYFGNRVVGNYHMYHKDITCAKVENTIEIKCMCKINNPEFIRSKARATVYGFEVTESFYTLSEGTEFYIPYPMNRCGGS